MKAINSSPKTEKKIVPRLILLILLVGVFFRISHFLSNRSFWLDEAYVALELSKLALSDILFFTPFSGAQAAPPMLFLFFEKNMIHFFGNCEYTLRAIPFFSGLVSLPLMLLFFKRYIHKENFVLLFFIFSVSNSLVYYSAELKPYSTDLFLSISLFLSCRFMKTNAIGYAKFLFLIFLGGFAVFFSYPSIFVLASISGVSLLSSLREKRKKFWAIFFIGFTWAVFFLVMYALQLLPIYQNSDFQKVLTGFVLYPPFSFRSLAGFFECFFFIFKNLFSTLGLVPCFVWGLIAVLGIIKSFLTQREKCLLFFIPLGLTVFATFLHKYPFMI